MVLTFTLPAGDPRVTPVALFSTLPVRVSSHLYGGATCLLLAVLAILGICKKGYSGHTQMCSQYGGARMSNLTCVADTKLVCQMAGFGV